MNFSSHAYGKVSLTPSFTSYLEMLMRIPTGMSQWISSWIFGISKIMLSMLITSTKQCNFFSPFVLSVDGICRNEDQVILSNLS